MGPEAPVGWALTWEGTELGTDRGGCFPYPLQAWHAAKYSHSVHRQEGLG
jgi:hypothetical protein